MVREQLDEAVLKHGHEDVHGRHQRLPLFRFLVSESKTSHKCGSQERKNIFFNPPLGTRSIDLLVVFDELVEAEQDAQPG